MTCPFINQFFAASGVEYSLNASASLSGFADATDVSITCNSVD